MSETLRLVEAARDGDRAAFDDLYRRHRGRLLALVAARMGSDLRLLVSPEDVVQETHLESARRIDAFESRGPASFYRWLVGIARNKIREAARRQRAKKRALESPLAADPAAERTSPSVGAARNERNARLADALAQLPDAQAEAVRLRYLEGLTVAETAERLDRTSAAVKALVSRGLGGLAERLATGF